MVDIPHGVQTSKVPNTVFCNVYYRLCAMFVLDDVGGTENDSVIDDNPYRIRSNIQETSKTTSPSIWTRSFLAAFTIQKLEGLGNGVSPFKNSRILMINLFQVDW